MKHACDARNGFRISLHENCEQRKLLDDEMKPTGAPHGRARQHSARGQEGPAGDAGGAGSLSDR